MTDNTHEKTAAGATNTSDGNKSLGNGSTTAYLHHQGSSTGVDFGTWGGAHLPMKDHVTVVIPIETVQRMYADGPQLVDINTACAEAQSAAVRKKREERKAEQRREKERLIRAEVEEEFLEELDELDAHHEKVYAQIDARVEARYRAGDQEGTPWT